MPRDVCVRWAVPIILQLVLKFPPDRCVARELAALICNLSLHASCAEILCSQQRGDGIARSDLRRADAPSRKREESNAVVSHRAEKITWT